MGLFVITQSCTNGMVALQYGPKKLGIIYVEFSHIHLIQMLNILPLKICMTMSTYDCQLYTSVLY